MKTSRLFLILLISSILFALDVPHAQIERGRQWFLHSSKGLACATCHSLEGNGNAIGPDHPEAKTRRHAGDVRPEQTPAVLMKIKSGDAPEELADIISI